MGTYSSFEVLLDRPSTDPVLGFEDYAGALSELILSSRPQFAVGIFGEWGAGKTTLIGEIARQLEQDPNVIQVHFNAWRYEREKHLVVPMLDTLREALAGWSSRQEELAEGAGGADDDTGAKARRAAATVGRAARALLAGLSLTGKVPWVGEATVEFDKVMAEFDRGDKERAEQLAAKQPLSFYHRSYVAMRDAIEPLVAEGERRIVIFVDDLDRCMPENALEVLESMKLLFDQLGFVFVVGLDQQVIESAVELKYGSANDGAAPVQPAIRGSDYIKKLFQVPFSLPKVRTNQIDEYYHSLVYGSELPGEQRAHFDEHVRPHLQFVTGGDEVNPREIKRLFNAYVLQLRMLAPKFEKSNQIFEPEVVLALQAMAFRADWAHLYDAMLSDPELFVESLRPDDDSGEQPSEQLWVGGQEAPVPPSFLAYLAGRGRVVLRPDLDIYLSSLQSSLSTDPDLVAMQRLAGKLHGLLNRLEIDHNLLGDPGWQGDARGALELLERKLQSRGERLAGGPMPEAVRALLEMLNALPAEEAQFEPWRNDFEDRLRQIDSLLAEMRRRTSVGAEAA